MQYTKDKGKVIATFSRLEILNTNINRSFAWITIACPKFTALTKMDNAEYILSLQYDDIDTITFPAAKNTDRKLFTEDDAKQIVDFVNSLPEEYPIIINCIAGLSRSTATAAAIAYCLGIDDSIFWEKTCPNQLVFQLICKAFGQEPPEREWTGISTDDLFTYEEE